MNNCVFEGNLVRPVELKSSNGKSYCFGKIGCYNGKDKDGEERPSMFIDFVAFGKDAELLVDKADKGSRILIGGILSREDVETETGEYVNLKITCNYARICVKADKKEPVAADDEWGD